MFSFLALTKSKSFPYSSLWDRQGSQGGYWGPSKVPASWCREARQAQ